MRIKRQKPPRWTQQELAVLEEFYPAGGMNAVVDLLPDRNERSIYMKAFKLGLVAPKAPITQELKLQGEQLEEAIRLRTEDGWGFARIGAKFGVCEGAAANAILAALCPRLGYKPAERDEHGNLLPHEIDRLRGMLRRGAKAIDICLQMGISQSRICNERRRYQADLKLRGKRPLPPPGNGARYSGARLTRDDRREIDRLLREGYGAPRIADQLGVSKTHILRARKRLIKALRRKGECLPGCDSSGRRIRHKDITSAIPAGAIAELRRRILDREPVQRAARACCIGRKSAYAIRDDLKRELEAKGLQLPKPKPWGNKPAPEAWMPKGPKQIARFRGLCRSYDPDTAREILQAELDAQARDRLAASQQAAQEQRVARGSLSFEQQLEMIRTGKARVARREVFIRPGPNITLGGIASAAL